VPLCRSHHRELHRAGKEVDWWLKTGLEPTGIAHELWMETHPLQQSPSSPSDVARDFAAVSLPAGTQRTKRSQLPGLQT
jgi:hypothetical protein